MAVSGGLSESGRKFGVSGDRTDGVEKEGCAERIARVGTLSQNGYGNGKVREKGTDRAHRVRSADFCKQYLANKLVAFSDQFFPFSDVWE